MAMLNLRSCNVASVRDSRMGTSSEKNTTSLRINALEMRYLVSPKYCSRMNVFCGRSTSYPTLKGSPDRS